MSDAANPIVHLELHTSNLARACSFYTAVFGWHAESIESSAGSYQAIDPASGPGAGVVESDTNRPLWLPYVRVDDIAAVTERAEAHGARVALEPREGPAGWRSVLAAGCGAEFALWQPKR
jgi:predicted enzyme related to lactoylglutathione lyase